MAPEHWLPVLDRGVEAPEVGRRMGVLMPFRERWSFSDDTEDPRSIASFSCSSRTRLSAMLWKFVQVIWILSLSRVIVYLWHFTVLLHNEVMCHQSVLDWRQLRDRNEEGRTFPNLLRILVLNTYFHVSSLKEKESQKLNISWSNFFGE